MKHDSSNKDSSPPKKWKRMRLDIALKTEVIARCRRRSGAEWREWRSRVEQVKP